ncbi:MAG TPA: hypothetical protein VNT81_02875 [Vicinamibacterales bacterium]|nr:hypothetical protein [Vicinamibacterales bacterium]
MNRPRTRILCLVLALLLAAPGVARADVFFVPFAGIKFGGSTSIVDLELAANKKALTLGASAIKLTNSIIGYEIDFGSVTGYFENGDLGLIKPGSYVIDLTGNVLLSLPPGATRGGLRPYLVAGGGLIHAEAEDVFEVFQIRRTVPAITLGVGAVGLLTNNVGVRFDVRHLRSLSKDASFGLVGRRIAYSRFTLGLLLRF